jgi:hypothetical protein
MMINNIDEGNGGERERERERERESDGEKKRNTTISATYRDCIYKTHYLL